MYKHQQLLAENVVDMATLPTPLQNMIAHFAEQEFDLEAEESSEDLGAETATAQEIRTLRATLKELDRTLYREIKRIIDHEITEDLSVEETKLSILQDFLRAGTHQVRIDDLKKAGYPLRNSLKINERVGPLTLIKKRYASKCSIVSQ